MADDLKFNDLIQDDKTIPKIQLFVLLVLLIIYPATSLILGFTGSSEPLEIESKIIQIYIPAIFVQSILILLVYFSLKQNKESLGSVGLGKSDITIGNMVSGVIFFVGAFTLMFIIKSAFTSSGYLPPEEIDYLLPTTVADKIFWFLLSLGAALSEELSFRGFIISRVKILSNKYVVGAIIGSIAFSMGHLYQGLSGVILTFIYGMLFAGLYIARRSLFPCVVAHFLQDIMVLFIL